MADFGFKKGNRHGRGQGQTRRVRMRNPNYTADELEFMLAVERWERDHHCLRPDDAELLAIAKSLGWRKD